MQPLVKSINVDDVPIMTLTLSSTQMPDYQLRQVSARVLEQLRSIPGVSFTELVGGARRAINVWISPAKLAAAGLSLDQVDKMLQGANVSMPIGTLVDGNRNFPAAAVRLYRQRPRSRPDHGRRAQWKARCS